MSPPSCLVAIHSNTCTPRWCCRSHLYWPTYSKAMHPRLFLEGHPLHICISAYSWRRQTILPVYFLTGRLIPIYHIWSSTVSRYCWKTTYSVYFSEQGRGDRRGACLLLHRQGYNAACTPRCLSNSPRNALLPPQQATAMDTFVPSLH